jgi:phage repressor protein C with HTH and peptisase S24 domain
VSTVITLAARFYVLSLELPGQPPLNAGVLLEDPSGRLHVRSRRDWDRIAPEEADVLSGVAEEFERLSRELGASALLDRLEDTLSNTLRISPAREIAAEDVARTLARLYAEHVVTEPRAFITHLPRYSLQAAAGRFLENREVTAEGWEEIPPGLRLTESMFVARVTGRSMEPRIPDGSLCVFRAGVTGSRQGRLVLVEYLGGGAGDRYTVKRYTGRKRLSAEGSWEHERIRLEPLNPAFEAWDLDPEEGRFRVIAEFVQVLY